MFTQSFILLFVATFASARWCCDPPTDYEKSVAKVVQYNNHNNDGVVDLGDIDYDLNNHYDKNKDNKTSRVEWVMARECLFGEDSGYALFSFARIDRNKDNFITMQDIAMGPVGTKPMTVAAFEAMNRKRYQDYKTGQIVGK